MVSEVMMIPASPISFADSGAVAAALAAAATLCQSRGAQFTEVRRGLLEALWRARQPLGAYDLLPRLEGSLGRRFGPTTVYRGLEFLMAQGLITRIESRNAFVPCAHPDRPHACVFFVCDCCGTSIEVENPALERLLTCDASKIGFQVSRKVIELQGTCAQCRIVV
jgi:Fur family transcriptional regulator, zinc uptake regulator